MTEPSPQVSRPLQSGPGFSSRLSREEINSFPIRSYTGPIHVIRSRPALDRAVSELSEETVLGFDTETRPSFTRGETYPPSLVQLAGHAAVYLFQLQHLHFPPALRRVLADPAIVKAGVAPERDVQELRNVGEFEPGGFVDIGALARRAGIQNHGLRGLAAVLLGFRISKRAQVSNWARSDLTDVQIRYAATDAWVSRNLFLCFESRFPQVFENQGPENARQATGAHTAGQ